MHVQVYGISWLLEIWQTYVQRKYETVRNVIFRVLARHIWLIMYENIRLNIQKLTVAKNGFETFRQFFKLKSTVELFFQCLLSISREFLGMIRALKREIKIEIENMLSQVSCMFHNPLSRKISKNWTSSLACENFI